MSLLHDLDDYKLETTFEHNPDRVIHTSYKSDRARGIRKAVVVKRWAPQKPGLGAGTFGTVRLENLLDIQDHDGTIVTQRAVKQLYKPQMARTNIDYKKELIALSKFSRSKFMEHQIFVEFFGWFEDKENVFLAMEYFPLGTLDKFIDDKLHEDDTRKISLQLLEGLHIMHEEGFTHRDLKPQNIFVVHPFPNWWVKIGDFGITKRVSNDDTALQTATGTPHYMAPEVRHYVDDPNLASGAYTSAVDIWSFACVVYTMLALQVPFPDPRGIVSFCRGGALPEQPLYPRTSPEGIQFVKSILIALPTSRPTAKEIMTKPWLHIGEASHEKSSPDVDPQPIQQTEEMAFRPLPYTPLPSPQRPAVPQELSSPNETVFSLLEPFTWVSRNTASMIHDPLGSEGISSTLKLEPSPVEVASTVSSNQQAGMNDNLPSPSPATINSFFSKEDKVEGLRLPESSTDKDESNQKVDDLPSPSPAAIASFSLGKDKVEGLRLPESSTGKYKSYQKVENLPSICLMPSHDLHHPERPSKLFDFDPIYRILPTENETLRIGRYFGRDAKTYDPRRVPSAARIGFKSKSVSRQHCEVWSSNGQWWIRDVGSSGGTFLNGQHLYADAEGSGSSPPYRLHDNDLLELGSGSSRSEHVMIQVSFKGWSKNRSSTEERGRVAQQDRKIPAAVERESETELGNKTVQNCVLFQYMIRKAKLRESIKVTPYIKEPTINNDEEKGWVAVTSVVEEKNTARVMRDLVGVGAYKLKVLNIASTMVVGDRDGSTRSWI